MPDKIEIGSGYSELRVERLKRLRRVTEDYEILDSVDDTAFSQDELDELIKKGTETIYLFGNSFDIPLSVRDKTYIGVNNPTVKFSGVGSPSENGITIEKCKLWEEKAKRSYTEAEYEDMIIEYAHNTAMSCVSHEHSKKYSYSLLDSSASDPVLLIRCPFLNTTSYNVSDHPKNFIKAALIQYKKLINEIGSKRLFYMNNIEQAASGSFGTLSIGRYGSFFLEPLCLSAPGNVEISIKPGKNREFSQRYLRKMVAVPCKEKVSNEVIYDFITIERRIEVGEGVIYDDSGCSTMDSGLNYIFPIVLVDMPYLLGSLKITHSSDMFCECENDLCNVSFGHYYGNEASWSCWDICETAEDFNKLCKVNLESDGDYFTIGDYLKEIND